MSSPTKHNTGSGTMHSQHSPIAVLGAGSWGSALAIHLGNNGQIVHLWDHDATHMQNLQQDKCNQRHLPGHTLTDNIQLETELAATVKASQDIVVAVPSAAFTSIVTQLKPLLTPSHRILWASKGLMPDSHELPRKYVQQILGQNRAHAILSGPSFAKEVVACMPTLLTLACQQKTFTQDLQQRLETKNFRLILSEDLTGVQLCGAVKNVIAIAAGMVDALGYGVNTQSALITCGLAEMARLGRVMGTRPKTFMGPAGIGDLLLTCSDNQSRNRRFGLQIGQGKTLEEAKQSIGQTIEGYTNTLSVHQLSERYHISMPLCESVYNIVKKQHPPDILIETLMNHGIE